MESKPGLLKLFASDPKCLELEGGGYRVHKQEWAASLDLTSDADLDLFKDRYVATLSHMFEIREIGIEYLEAVYALKMANSHSQFHFLGKDGIAPTLSVLANEWREGNLFFGAFDGDLLIGVLESELRDGRIFLTLCHIDPERKYQGISTGLTSYAILYWVTKGIRHFASCGDQIVPDRQEVLEHLGFNIHDQIRNLRGQRNLALKVTTLESQMTRPKGKVHPTKQKLLEVTVALLENQIPEAIKSDEVLEKSGVVKGSLYYHFEDFSDLLESAQILAFERHVEGMLEGMLDSLRDILLTNEDPQSARLAFESEALHRKLNISRDLRIERFSVIYGAITSERMRSKLIPTQEALVLRWMEIIDICKSRGWADDLLDSRSVAILIQGANLSRVIDDISYSHVDSVAWFRTLTFLLDSFFFGGIKGIQS